MKLAILFSGRIARHQEHYNNILDAFGRDNEIDFFLSHDPTLDEDINEFINLYKPVAVCDEAVLCNINFESYPGSPRANNIHNMGCHFINKMRVFDLLEKHVGNGNGNANTNLRYDYIIHHRLDVHCHDNIDYGCFVKNKENQIYIPYVPDWMCNGGDYIAEFLNDQMAIGDFESMKKYMNIYNNLVNLLENGCPPHPETLLRRHVDNIGLRVDRFYTNYQLKK
jgi:hypothetical protein